MKTEFNEKQFLNKLNMYQYENLEEALIDLDWYLVSESVDEQNTIDTICEFLNPFIREKDNSPRITAKHKTIIVLDNCDFNETYLIDLVSKVLKDKNYKPGDYDLVYCDSFDARYLLQYGKEIDDEEKEKYKNKPIQELEKQFLSSGIFVINPDHKFVTYKNDKYFGMVADDVEKLLECFDDKFYKNME